MKRGRFSEEQSLDDVSRLLGHSSVKITEQYYAKWVAARKVRLESVVADAVGAPQPYTTACRVEKREVA